ncbi:LuxR C-terminal-related transcriptional regulator [Brevibacillus fortis]|uniref:LuxR C-terminal-related transcriptional regulator n=1 Tax=Brevibacillus fortis TaxID=2126352 RepID=UPI003CC55256
MFLRSKKEKEILRLIGQGLSDSEITTSQHISLSTVRAHVRNVLASEALGLYSESKEKFNDS